MRGPMIPLFVLVTAAGCASHESMCPCVATGGAAGSVPAEAPPPAPSAAAPARGMLGGPPVSASTDHPRLCVERFALRGKREAAGVHFWPPGTTLHVAFVDGKDAYVAKIKAYISQWSSVANIHFDFSSSPKPEIRVAFVPGIGSWSWVGTDALKHPAPESTVNFAWLADDLPEDQFRQVVLHEFGHVMGLIHEHQSPAADFEWDTDALKRYFGPGTANNWDDATIQANIVERTWLPRTNYTAFDQNSIMLYWFDKGLVKKGLGAEHWNTELSTVDKQFVQQKYGATTHQ